MTSVPGFMEGVAAGMQSQMRERAGVLPFEVALGNARSAWSRGDFIGCLSVLDEMPLPRVGSEPWIEATLLRGRSFYRLKRYRETISLLEPVLLRFADGDEVCTAHMLLGSSIARSGDVARGLQILEATAAQAEAPTVHHAVRAEIAHARALAHWTRREHDQTERLARFAESAGADIISVRATQLRAFVALTQQRFTEALALFNATVDAYWNCRQRDADLAEMAVFEISALELMLRSRHVRGTHGEPDRRRVRDPWSVTPEVASVARLQTHAFDAWLFAHDGDRDTAFRKMRRAEEMAAGVAWRIWALANRASLAAAFGELGSAREHAALAAELSASVDWPATTGEERMGLLFLAEIATVTDPAAALAAMETYDTLAPMDPGQAVSTDPRLSAFEDYVRGLVFRLHGKYEAATTSLKAAAARFMACGHLWRGALAQFEFAATSSRGEHFDAARAIVTEHFPKSFLARRAGTDPMSDPIVSGLTPSQREVLALLLDGLGAREIATRTGRAYNTVRVHIDRLREAFQTSSIQALVVECHRRGIVFRSPSTVHERDDEAIRHCG